MAVQQAVPALPRPTAKDWTKKRKSHSTRRLYWGTTTLCAAIVCLFPIAASASSDERALSLRAGYSQYRAEETTHPGGYVGADYVHGLSEAFFIAKTLHGGLHTKGGLHPTLALSSGLGYYFDVLTYVPYAIVGGQLFWAGESTGDPILRPGLFVTLGVDVLKSPSRSWGLYVRGDSIVQEPASISLGFRITWRWGFF